MFNTARWCPVSRALGLLIVPTCLWYAMARSASVQWGTITTSMMNTVLLVLMLLLATNNCNPLWLPIAALRRLQVARVLEQYGHEVTRSIDIFLLVMCWSKRVKFMEIHLSKHKTCLCACVLCVCASASDYRIYASSLLLLLYTNYEGKHEESAATSENV